MKVDPFEKTELQMKAEAHNAKAALLLAGVSKMMSDMICGSTWGNQITVDTAIGALQEAKREMQRATAILASIDFAPKSVRTLLKTASPKRRR